jgi:hypothetical protein
MIRHVAVRDASDAAERARRVHILFALFAIYTTGLTLVVVMSDGADIGCLLAALAAHLVYVAWRRSRAPGRDAILVRRKSGVAVLGRKARLLKRSDVAQVVLGVKRVAVRVQGDDVALEGIRNEDAEAIATWLATRKETIPVHRTESLMRIAVASG